MEFTENEEITVKFSVSKDAEAKLAKESQEFTVKIVYKDWTHDDFLLAASKPIIIGRLQEPWRKDRIEIPKVYEAGRPGSRGITVVKVNAKQALLKLVNDEDLAEAMIEEHGSAEAAVLFIRSLLPKKQ